MSEYKPRSVGRPRTGSVESHGDHLDARPTLADGSRGARVCLPAGTSPEKAREIARALTERAQEAGTVREVIPPPGAPMPAGPTLEDWAAAWCEDREARGLSSVEDDRGRLRRWIQPRLVPPLGSRPMAGISKTDLEQLVEDIDARVRAGELSWKTAKNVWGLVTKAFKDACKAKTAALRVRNDNPALDVAGPDEGAEKAKAYLYPSEFLAVVTCARVPIRWRRLIALHVYLYARAGEIEAVGVEDVDVAHRVIHIHRSIHRRKKTVKTTKTNCPRRFAVEPQVLPLLDRFLEDARAAGRERLVKMPPMCDWSARLRKYLRWAGVERAELFANDATRKQITWHDLRATGITWMAVRGDDPTRIMHRAGHENMATTMGYVREAESLEYLRGDVFPPLPEALFLPGLLPETPSDWGKLAKSKTKASVPSGIRTRSNVDEAQPSSKEKRAADEPPGACVVAKCPEGSDRAESGQNQAASNADPDGAAALALVGRQVLVGSAVWDALEADVLWLADPAGATGGGR